MIFGLETKTQPISKEQVWESWKRIRKGGKGAGTDGITISMIEENPRKYFVSIMEPVDQWQLFSATGA